MALLSKPRCKSQSKINKSNKCTMRNNIRSYSLSVSLSDRSVNNFNENNCYLNYWKTRKYKFQEERKQNKRYFYQQNKILNDYDLNKDLCQSCLTMRLELLSFIENLLENTNKLFKIGNKTMIDMKNNNSIKGARKYPEKNEKNENQVKMKAKNQNRSFMANHPFFGNQVPKCENDQEIFEWKDFDHILGKYLNKSSEKGLSIITPLEPSFGLAKMAPTSNVYDYPLLYVNLQPEITAEMNDESMASKPFQRAFKKLSFTNYDNMSPIKPSEANLRPVTLGKGVFNRFQGKDNFIFGYTWIVNMTEQFYYDNSLILLKNSSECPEKLQSSLKSSFNPKDFHYFNKYWNEISFAGKGGFGTVYKVFDSKENRYIAVKLIKQPQKKTIYYHRRLLLDFLSERRYILNSNKSPYVISFLYSGKLPSSSSLMLVFEYCLTDLDRAFQMIRNIKINKIDDTHPSVALYDKTPNFVSFFYERFQKITQVNIFNIVVIYVFEMFCALDFLAQRNIIHRDIKPQNIMIGQNLHLKMADFGLIYNTSFITRKTQITLVEHSDIDKTESTNYQSGDYCGTSYFYDPELCFDIYSCSPHFPEFMRANSQHLRVGKFLDYDPLQDFMSDLFSIGLTMCHVIFLGDDPFYAMPEVIKSELGLFNDHIYNKIRLFLFEYYWTDYINEGLTAMSDEYSFDLLNILKSSLDLREQRGSPYIEYKEIILHGGIRRTLPYFSIKKFENVRIFKTNNITLQNAYLYPIDPIFGILITNHKPQEIIPNFKALMQSITDLPSNLTIYPLIPGTACDN